MFLRLLAASSISSSPALQQEVAVASTTAVAAGVRAFAAKAKGGSSAKAADELIPAKDWKAIKLPAQTADTVPVTKYPGQAFVGDLR